MRFEKILVVGSGKTATDCVRILCGDLHLKNIAVIESAENQFSMLKSVSAKYGLPYKALLIKDQITGLILKTAECESLLIISANNRYLFPKEICDLRNTEIINFHYGYLPRYRGMNIPTWVIYNDEPFTGVTWHYVTSEVDRGEIISQQKIMLNDTITAYEVVREGMRVGTELFKTFIPELLTKRIDGKKIVTEEFVYLNRALPQNGMLDTSKNITDIYRLLRSFDYGRTDTLKPLKVLWKGNSYFVRSYSLTGNAEESAGRRTDLHDKILTVCENGKKLTINLQDGHA